LDLLGEEADVVALEQATAMPETGRLRVAITWDDAYRGAISSGVDEVVRRGLPATIFVSPGRLGDQTFWWDALGDKYGGEIPQAVRQCALDDCGGDEGRIAARFGLNRAGSVPPHARTASEAELVQAAGRPGIMAASHTWSHLNLARLEGHVLDEELVRSRDWLLQRVERHLPALSYPYGIESPEVRRAAARAGYETAWGIRGGRVSIGADRMALPRFNVPAGLSLDGLALRLAGLFLR
jgi:peptidoglycan/xylan/chitin deacetylase (PgdA/CDA1 family)